MTQSIFVWTSNCSYYYDLNFPNNPSSSESIIISSSSCNLCLKQVITWFTRQLCNRYFYAHMKCCKCSKWKIQVESGYSLDIFTCMRKEYINHFIHFMSLPDMNTSISSSSSKLSWLSGVTLLEESWLKLVNLVMFIRLRTFFWKFPELNWDDMSVC